MTNMSRRQALGGMVAGAASVPVAARALGQQAHQFNVPTQIGSELANVAPSTFSPPSWWADVHRAIDKLYRQRDLNKIDGLAFDIFALRSVPLAQKIRMQIARDAENTTKIEALRKLLSPEGGSIVDWHRLRDKLL